MRTLLFDLATVTSCDPVKVDFGEGMVAGSVPTWSTYEPVVGDEVLVVTSARGHVVVGRTEDYAAASSSLLTRS